MERKLYIDDVREGLPLAENIYAPNTNLPIIKSGVILTSKHIAALKKFGIKEVTVDATPQQLKMLEINGDVLPTIDRVLAESAKKSITPIRINGKVLVNVQDVVDDAEKIKNRIIMPREYDTGKLAYRLSSYKTDKTNEDKAVRVATFATVIANEYNKTCSQRERLIDLTEIATAALLHNFGAVCEDDKIRNEIFIPEYRRIYQSLDEETRIQLVESYNPAYIPLYSYVLLKDNPDLKDSSVLKQMIANSRENRLGKGPLGSKQLKSGNSRFIIGSLIISLSALYDDALINNIKETSTLENVQSQLERIYLSKAYDPELIELLIKNIPLYPVGTKVLLGGPGYESYAIVIESFTNSRDYHRPKVLTIPDNEEIDLRRTTNVTIKSVVGSEVDYEIMYKEQARETKISSRRRY